MLGEDEHGQRTGNQTHDKEEREESLEGKRNAVKAKRKDKDQTQKTHQCKHADSTDKHDAQHTKQGTTSEEHQVEGTWRQVIRTHNSGKPLTSTTST